MNLQARIILRSSIGAKCRRRRRLTVSNCTRPMPGSYPHKAIKSATLPCHNHYPFLSCKCLQSVLWLSAFFAVTCNCHKYRNQEDHNDQLNCSHQNIHSHDLIQSNPMKYWHHWNPTQLNRISKILTPHNHMFKISHKTILVPSRQRHVWGLSLAHQWDLTWVIQRTDYPQSQVCDEECLCQNSLHDG